MYQRQAMVFLQNLWDEMVVVTSFQAAELFHV